MCWPHRSGPDRKRVEYFAIRDTPVGPFKFDNLMEAGTHVFWKWLMKHCAVDETRMLG